MSFLTRTKPIAPHTEHVLKRMLSWPHLVALGVGAIVGTGIYTLIGEGAKGSHTHIPPTPRKLCVGSI